MVIGKGHEHELVVSDCNHSSSLRAKSADSIHFSASFFLADTLGPNSPRSNSDRDFASLTSIEA